MTEERDRTLDAGEKVQVAFRATYATAGLETLAAARARMAACPHAVVEDGGIVNGYREHQCIACGAYWVTADEETM